MRLHVLKPDNLAHLLALVPAMFHSGAIRVPWVQRCTRYVIQASSFSFHANACRQNRQLVAAQLPRLLDQRDQRRGVNGERLRLGSTLFGDPVEIGLSFWQLGDKMPAELYQIGAVGVAKYLCRSGIADRQRRR